MKFAKVKDLTVSKIALGTWAMGGGRDWGKTDETLALETVARALDAGITTIDCAPIYGLGASEELLGRALKGKRHKVVLTSKCGLIPAPRAVKRCLKPESIKQEIETSLKRLQTDYIDIYFIHWPDRDTPLEDTLGAMENLKKQGKIRQIGVCNFDKDLLERALKCADVACLQNEYSFLHRESQNIFDLCAKSGTAFFAYGPLAGGILSGKYKKEPNLPRNDARSFFYPFYKGEEFKKSLEIAKRFEEVAAKHNAPPSQAAINWVLSNPAVTCALAGARKPQHILAGAAATDWHLSPEEKDFLENGHN